MLAVSKFPATANLGTRFSKFKKTLCGDVQLEPKALWDKSSLTLLAHRFGGY
jgi:hypothetical protein